MVYKIIYALFKLTFNNGFCNINSCEPSADIRNSFTFLYILCWLRVNYESVLQFSECKMIYSKQWQLACSKKIEIQYLTTRFRIWKVWRSIEPVHKSAHLTARDQLRYFLFNKPAINYDESFPDVDSGTCIQLDCHEKSSLKAQGALIPAIVQSVSKFSWSNGLALLKIFSYPSGDHSYIPHSHLVIWCFQYH